jgi:hypothetical protein
MVEHYAIHGTARVAIVACPTILGSRLGVLSSKGEFSWTIRDYIGNRVLRSKHSELTFSQIERLVNYSMEPPYRSAERKKEWANELVMLSRAHFKSKYDGRSAPNDRFGKWKALPS